VVIVSMIPCFPSAALTTNIAMIAIGASLAKTNFKSLAEGQFSHPKNERIRIDPIRQIEVSSIRTFSKANEATELNNKVSARISSMFKGNSKSFRYE
jgi:hypothetical protein